MESTGRPQPPPDCPCQQQLGGALPWLVIALAMVLALDRWRVRRRKQKSKQQDAAGGGADGGKI